MLHMLHSIKNKIEKSVFGSDMAAWWGRHTVYNEIWAGIRGPVRNADNHNLISSCLLRTRRTALKKMIDA